MGGKRTSYAKLVELAAQKRGKFEKQLEDAQRRGDRFGINSAMRSISRLEEYEQEVFDSQEQQKIDKGITPPQPQMAYGGMPMFNVGGPTKAQAEKLYADYLKARTANAGRFRDANVFGDKTNDLLLAYETQMENKDYGNLSQEFYDAMSNAIYNTGVPAYMPPVNPNAYGPFAPQDDTRVAMDIGYTDAVDPVPPPPFLEAPRPSPGTQFLPNDLDDNTPKVTPKVVPTPVAPKKRAAEPIMSIQPKGLDNIFTPQGAQLIDVSNRASMEMPTPQTGPNPYANAAMQGLDALGKVAPYALQFAPDLYALNQLKQLEGPVDAPFQRATQINTDIDTTATRARIQDNMRTFNAGVDSGMSNSAAVQNVKLANLAQTNRQLADIGQQEVNQETMLRNQQSTLLNQTFNANLGIDAANRQRRADFENMITNARLGIVQGMGTKAFQMNQENNQMKLDRQRLETLARQFDQGLLARNFTNIEMFRQMANNGNPELLKSLSAAMKQSPQIAAQIKADDVNLYNKLMNL